jgi:formylmethanofuran dehydrogenase subunit D
MNKFLRFFFVALMGLLGMSNAFADEVEIDFSAQGLENATDVTTMDFRSSDGNKIVVTFENGTNEKNGPKYYNTGTAIRCYGGNKINVKLNLETEVVTKVDFTFGSGDGSNELIVKGDAAEGSLEGGTWTGRAVGSITAEVGGTSGHRRIQKMTFTLSPKGDVTKTSTSVDFSGDYVTRFTPGKDGDETFLPTATVKAGEAAVEGANVKWTLKMGSNWVMGEEEPSIYDGKVYIPNHSNGDLTLTAKYEGNDTYEGSSKNYTLKVYKGYMNIRSILEDFPEIGGDTWKEKEEKWNKGEQISLWEVDAKSETEFTSKDALVTYANGSYTYIKDDYGTLLLYGSGLGFKQGDVISGDFGNDQGYGAIYGTLKTYNGLLELAVNKGDVEFVVKSSDNPVEPKTIVLKELNQSNMNEYLKIENAEFVEANGKNLTFKVGDETLAVYNQWNLKIGDDEKNSLLKAGTKYDLTGMGSVYWKNETLANQLYLISFDERGNGQGVKSFKMTINHDGEVFTESFPATDWENVVIDGKTSSIKIMKVEVGVSKPMKYVGFIGTMFNTEDGWQHDDTAWRTVDLQKQEDGSWTLDLGEGQELVESEWLNKNKTKTFEFFIYAEDESGTPIHYNNGGNNYRVTFSTGGDDDPNAISNVKAENSQSGTYNLSGQPVTRTYRGVTIQNARKVLRK